MKYCTVLQMFSVKSDLRYITIPLLTCREITLTRHGKKSHFHLERISNTEELKFRINLPESTRHQIYYLNPHKQYSSILQQENTFSLNSSASPNVSGYSIFYIQVNRLTLFPKKLKGSREIAFLG